MRIKSQVELRGLLVRDSEPNAAIGRNFYTGSCGRYARHVSESDLEQYFFDRHPAHPVARKHSQLSMPRRFPFARNRGLQQELAQSLKALGDRPLSEIFEPMH